MAVAVVKEDLECLCIAQNNKRLDLTSTNNAVRSNPQTLNFIVGTVLPRSNIHDFRTRHGLVEAADEVMDRARFREDSVARALLPKASRIQVYLHHDLRGIDVWKIRLQI